MCLMAKLNSMINNILSFSKSRLRIARAVNMIYSHNCEMVLRIDFLTL